ncbi:MAG TPA: ABC transporter permease [Candidatus Acidoferrales bacterium]|nr:ABC transporter permease [Candidatus Acidoferrales bacterium]
MRAIQKLRLRLRSLFRPRRMESELDAELRFHVDQQMEENISAGMEPDEARRAALRAMGDLTQHREECRDMRGVNWIENLLQDLRYGMRTLRQAPGFAAVAVLTLALGIGSNTAIFSVVQAALLRPLPYAQPDRLITLGEVRSQSVPDPLAMSTWNASYPDFLDWRAQSRTLQSLAGFNTDGFTLRGAGEPESVFAVQVTPNFFSTLGVRPRLGRDFHAGEDEKSGPHVAILMHSFWKSRFHGDPAVVGRSIQLDANSVTIVGVLPPEFEFAPRGNVQLWVPLHIGDILETRRNLRWISAVGRLAPGATLAQAEAEMGLINTRLAAAYPRENGATAVIVATLSDRILGKLRVLVLVLFGAVGFVLLIACANVATLLMARSARRRREFAVRAALGAGRGRLTAQLLCESLMLASAGAALGLAVARYGTGLLIAAIPDSQLNSMPFLRGAHADAAVLAFLLATTMVTGVAFGLAPLLEISNFNLGETLQDESRGSSAGARTRLRQALVIAEIAFSLVLLVGAGLMVKSLGLLLSRNPGFNTRRLLTFSVFLQPSNYPQSSDMLRFDRDFRDRIRAIPGVIGVATTSIVPLTGGGNTIRFVVEGQPTAPGQDRESNIRIISADYFSLMGIPLLAGRFFNDTDETASGPRRVIVNQAWIKRNLPGENPIGKRVRFTNSPAQPFREIVGVVGDNADAGLDSSNEPGLFTPARQAMIPFLTYLVRTAGEPLDAAGSVRAALQSVDSQLMLIQPNSMDQIIAQSPSVFLRRYPSFLIGSFAVLALTLAMVGLYGLISYSVSQRTREVGIRIALGAQPRDVIRLVVWEGARLTLMGIAAGVLAALGLTRLMRSLLFGVSAVDPFTFAAVALVLALVAITASYIPARRAVRTSPIDALRCE